MFELLDVLFVLVYLLMISRYLARLGLVPLRLGLCIHDSLVFFVGSLKALWQDSSRIRVSISIDISMSSGGFRSRS